MPYSESFFAASAQVLPTLLIAFIIEIGSIIKVSIDRLANIEFAPNTSLPPSIAASPEKRHKLTNWQLMWIDEDKVLKKVLVGLAILTSLFVIGEFLSLDALTWGPSTKRNRLTVEVATDVILFINIATLLTILALPIIRVFMEVGDKLFIPVKWEKESRRSNPDVEGDVGDVDNG